MSNFTVRLSTDKDVDAVLLIQKECYTPDLLEDGAAFGKLWKSYPKGCFFLENKSDSKEPVGYVFVFPFKRGEIHELSTDVVLDGKENCLYIHDMAIRPKFRGKGCSTVLLNAVDKLTRELGFTVQSLTAVHPTKSPPFWLKNGFKAIRDFDYGPLCPATFMERTMSEATKSAESSKSTASEATDKKSTSNGNSSASEWTKTPATEFLRSAGVEYAEHHFEYVDKGGTKHSSSKLGVSEHAVIKTLVFQLSNKPKDENDKAKFTFLVLMHGDREVDKKLLPTATGFKKSNACSVTAAEEATGYQVGGTSPFATRYALPVFIEQSLLKLPRIWINGGRRGFLVSMVPTEIPRVLGDRCKPVTVAASASGAATDTSDGKSS